LCTDKCTYVEQRWSSARTLTINVPLFKKLRDIIFFGGPTKKN
jgi:hypothetical protein